MRCAALLLYVLVTACHRGAGSMPADDQEMAAPEQHPDEHAAMAAEHAMAGMVSNEDLHLRLTPVRPAAPGDSARAAETLAVMRRELADARRRWRETKDGQPLFGPKSPIATAEACEAVGGRFRPRLFGWMVHVMAFAGVDPWNAHHH